MNFFDYGGYYHRKGKTRLSAWLTGLDPAIKLKVIMRINFVAIFLLFTMLHVSASIHAQKISLSADKAPLRTIFNEIEKQSGYEVWCNTKLLESSKPVTVKVSGDLKTVLEKVLSNQALSYEIVEKAIVIKPKAVTLIEKVTRFINAIKITGLVTDEKGQLISGVTIKVKNSTITAISGSDGRYSIEVPDADAVLQFSYVGYQSAEKVVGRNSVINIILREVAAKLEEVGVISTGYQQLPKERATGSFGQINNELYNRQISTDVISRLKNIAPSLLFDERSGVTKLNIRGQSTIFANNQPLIVVDNFPFDGNINSINPNDVESITVLRDAAAASIWGVRAGNGVIVITTKKGSYEKAPQVSINSNVTIGNRPDVFYTPQMNVADFIDLEVNLFNLGRYNDQLNNVTNVPPVSPVVDILDSQKKGTITSDIANSMIQSLKAFDIRNDLRDYFYQKSINQQYALNFNGGGKKYGYYLSAGYDNNKMNKVGNAYERISLNANNTYKPFPELEIGANLVYSQNNTTMDNTLDNIRISGSQAMYPYARLVGDAGEALPIVKDYRSSFAQGASARGYLDWQYRPYDELNFSDNKSRTLSTRVNTFIKYSFLKGLDLEGRYQYENQTYTFRNLQSTSSYYTRDLINSYTTIVNNAMVRNIPFGGIISTQNQALESHSGRLQTNYNNQWGDHELNAIAGYEARQIRTNGYSGKYYGYQEATGATTNVNYTASYTLYPKGTGGTIPPPGSISATVDRFRSYFFNGAYTYKSRYTVSASARRDESNLFGVAANQKGVPLWSAGLAWNATKETFVKLPFDLLKLRASYGYNGNFDNTVTAFTTARTSGNFVFTQQPQAVLVTPPNANLSWERIGILNFGVDLAALENRVSGSIDVYFKRGKDLLGFGNLNATTGFTSFKGNIASTKGKGLDVQLNSLNLTGQVQWRTSILFSYVADRVTAYEQKPLVAELLIDNSAINGAPPTPVIGRPLFGIYSYKWAGLSAANGDPQGYLNGVPSTNYASIQSQPMESESLLYHGRATPSSFGALRNTFNYEGVELSFNIGYKFGYYFRRRSISYNDLVNNYNNHSDYALRWQKPGDELVTYVPSFVYPNNSNRDLFYLRSEALVEKADHIRLQDIQLSYSLGERLLKRLPFANFQVFAYANNVGILWRANKHRIDPDYGNFLPQPRSIAFGIRTNFK